MRLGDLISVHCCREGEILQPGDVVIRRIGSEKDVGRVLESVTENRSSAFCEDDVLILRITDKNRLLPEYLRYMMEYIHVTGYYRTVAKGSLRRKCIRIGDVTRLPARLP